MPPPAPYLVYRFRSTGLTAQDIACPSCREPWTRPVMLKGCEHIFCRTCIPDELKECPVCKLPVTGVTHPPRMLIDMADMVPVQCEDCKASMTRSASFAHHCLANIVTAAPVTVSPVSQPPPPTTSPVGSINAVSAPTSLAPANAVANAAPPPQQPRHDTAVRNGVILSFTDSGRKSRQDGGVQLTVTNTTPQPPTTVVLNIPGPRRETIFSEVNPLRIPHFCIGDCANTQLQSRREPGIGALVNMRFNAGTGAWDEVDPNSSNGAGSRGVMYCEKCFRGDTAPIAAGDVSVAASDNRHCHFELPDAPCAGMPLAFRGCEHSCCAEHMRRRLAYIAKATKEDLLKHFRPMQYALGMDSDTVDLDTWGIACPACVTLDRPSPAIGLIPISWLRAFAQPGVEKAVRDNLTAMLSAATVYCASCGVASNTRNNTCVQCQAAPCSICRHTTYCLHGKCPPPAKALDAMLVSMVLNHVYVKCHHCQSPSVSCPSNLFVPVGSAEDWSSLFSRVDAYCPCCGVSVCAVCGGDGSTCGAGNPLHRAFLASVANLQRWDRGVLITVALYTSRALAATLAVVGHLSRLQGLRTLERGRCDLPAQLAALLGDGASSVHAACGSPPSAVFTWRMWINAGEAYGIDIASAMLSDSRTANTLVKVIQSIAPLVDSAHASSG